MSSYSKGYYLENKIIKNFPFAVRSAGSHGSFDVYIFTPERVFGVQLKKGLTTSKAMKLLERLNKTFKYKYFVPVVAGVAKKGEKKLGLTVIKCGIIVNEKTSQKMIKCLKEHLELLGYLGGTGND